MQIYILTRLGIAGYDQYDSKVVIAEDKARARKLANVEYGDEGKIWEMKTRYFAR